MPRIAPFLLLLVGALPANAEPSLTARAEEVLRRANDEKDAAVRFVLADESASLCERAAKASPNDPEPLILLANALSVSDPVHPEMCRPGTCERAVSTLQRARAVDANGLNARRIAGDLGIVLSRLGRHAEALAEYQRALKLVEGNRDPNYPMDVGDNATLYGNAAETLMALGRLEDAISAYRRARESSSHAGLSWELALWGEGLALDRDGQREAARSAVQRALDIDPAMRRLNAEGVFFEPPGDKLAYLALGHEVAGDRELALESWRAFLAASAGSRYTRRAGDHVDDLKKELAARRVETPHLRVLVAEVENFGGFRRSDELREEITRYEGDLRLCYQRALRQSPQLHGEALLEVDIHPLGITSGATLRGPHVITRTFESPDLESCLESAAGMWRFRIIDGMQPERVAVRLRFERAAR
jgi:tetratricopeptide (TPR) repeat protein